MPDREISSHQRSVSLIRTRLDKPHLCPRRLQRLPRQRESQLHRPGRGSPSPLRWVGSKAPPSPWTSRSFSEWRKQLLSAASITAGGRGRDPLGRPESGGG